jgi:hypothetical protein
MTNSSVQALLASSVGKRVTLESRGAVLSGVIYGLGVGPVSGRACLQVRNVSTTFKDDREPYDAPVDHVDLWGLPPEDATRDTRDGNTVLSWQDRFCDEVLPYALTIFE